MIYAYIWQFDVAEENQLEFEHIYGPEGVWVRLFRSDPNYIGTQLIREIHVRGRYMTIDRWKDRDSYLAFKAIHHTEFDLLDRKCEALTTNETKIGEYELVE